ncbi:MAG: hypothetical protein IIC61_08330 [Proteobacteria bacterium]|nr:hypothetical protein [Pseudomonadota bacterium]
MLKMKSSLVWLTLIALSLSACSKEPEETSASALVSSEGLLKYVPADTPYLLAMPVALPDDVLDKLQPQVDVTLHRYPALIKGILTSMIATKEAEGEESGDLRGAMAFVDELGRLLCIQGLRAAGIDRDSRFVMYGTGILPVMRTTLSDGTLLEAAFARLEESADKKMSVATISNYEYRFAGDDGGRVIAAILDSVFLDDQSGVNAELKSMIEDVDSKMSDACKDDLRCMAGIMPRIVIGYTDVKIEKLSSQAVFELRQDLAAGREILDQPVPPVGYGFKGFLAVVEDIEGLDLQSEIAPTSIDMRLLVSIDNAEGLLAMGAMFSPELAALDLQPMASRSGLKRGRSQQWVRRYISR